MRKIAIISNGNLDGRKFKNYEAFHKSVDVSTKSMKTNLYPQIANHGVEFKHYIELNSNFIKRSRPVYDTIIRNLNLSEDSNIKHMDDLYSIIDRECGVNLWEETDPVRNKMVTSVFQYYFFFRKSLQILEREPDIDLFLRARPDVFYYNQWLPREFVDPRRSLIPQFDPPARLRTTHIQSAGSKNPIRNLFIHDQFFSIDREAVLAIKSNMSRWVFNLLHDFRQAQETKYFQGQFPETSLGYLAILAGLDCNSDIYQFKLLREEDFPKIQYYERFIELPIEHFRNRIRKAT